MANMPAPKPKMGQSKQGGGGVAPFSYNNKPVGAVRPPAQSSSLLQGFLQAKSGMGQQAPQPMGQQLKPGMQKPLSAPAPQLAPMKPPQWGQQRGGLQNISNTPPPPLAPNQDLKGENGPQPAPSPYSGYADTTGAPSDAPYGGGGDGQGGYAPPAGSYDANGNLLPGDAGDPQPGTKAISNGKGDFVDPNGTPLPPGTEVWWDGTQWLMQGTTEGPNGMTYGGITPVQQTQSTPSPYPEGMNPNVAAELDRKKALENLYMQPFSSDPYDRARASSEYQLRRQEDEQQMALERAYGASGAAGGVMGGDFAQLGSMNAQDRASAMTQIQDQEDAAREQWRNTMIEGVKFLYGEDIAAAERAVGYAEQFADMAWGTLNNALAAQPEWRAQKAQFSDMAGAQISYLMGKVASGQMDVAMAMAEFNTWWDTLTAQGKWGE